MPPPTHPPCAYARTLMHARKPQSPSPPSAQAAAKRSVSLRRSIPRGFGAFMGSYYEMIEQAGEHDEREEEEQEEEEDLRAELAFQRGRFVGEVQECLGTVLESLPIDDVAGTCVARDRGEACLQRRGVSPTF
jgi:hypothetical protein